MSDTREPKGARRMSLRRQLGLRIVQARRRRRWNQETLASRVGVTRAVLGRWERGLNAPSLEGVVKLAEVLEVTFDELFRGIPSPPAQIPPDQRNELTMRFNALGRAMQSLLQSAERKKKEK